MVDATCQTDCSFTPDFLVTFGFAAENSKLASLLRQATVDPNLEPYEIDDGASSVLASDTSVLAACDFEWALETPQTDHHDLAERFDIATPRSSCAVCAEVHNDSQSIPLFPLPVGEGEHLLFPFAVADVDGNPDTREHNTNDEDALINDKDVGDPCNASWRSLC